MKSSVPSHRVVSRQEWLKARKAHLAKEKAFTRQRDELTRESRQLPWVKVDKNYVFDGADGKTTLAELFDGRSQLIIYHFMFAPEWSQGCKSCSLLADHFNPAIIHLNHRDVSMAVVSRAPIGKIQAFRERMGWTFDWVSSQESDFNRDYGVSFTEQEARSGLPLYNYEATPFPIQEAPGLSVFYRDDAGDIFHTYSTYSRGLDIFLGVYNFLDRVPKGRDEEHAPGMAWVRHHDRYDNQPFVDPWHEQPAGKPQAVASV
jgi:predicted dithiol-disulfide oxidoreductase (DUF899 family)